ncbi:YdeI/OmpD-associated family protein [Pontibacter ruber]|uniref:YdeI/OmpD-associated family protein n=1 Tax=Pontibacter ruber TaxID=1343895 RepID=A0ABW5D085_9BACT|nr:YdeI/OmpD-associated family protein [Pontibacter ruber]
MPDSFLITYKTPIRRLQHLVNMHYLEVPAEVVQQLGGKFNVRLLCTVNSALTFQCGLVALGSGSGYISLNAKRMKELGVRVGEQVQVNLRKDESRYGMEMPAELAELLEQDEEGKRRFGTLTPGRQRYIIHYVASVKSSQLRIDRAILLIENLKMLPAGKESFRGMLGLT